LPITFQCPGGVSERGPSAQKSGDRALEVGPVDEDRYVRSRGRGVLRIAGAVVGAEPVVESDPRRDVDHFAGGDVVLAAEPDQLDDRVLFGASTSPAPGSLKINGRLLGAVPPPRPNVTGGSRSEPATIAST
jgi:hypothetical protein